MNYNSFNHIYNNPLNIQYDNFIFDLINKYVEKRKLPNENLLDLGCGTGNVTNKFKNLGLNCSGLDISEGMIEIAKQNYPEINFELQDVVKTNNNYFDKNGIVISTYDVINHLKTSDEVFMMFRNAHQYLVKGGYFVFDIIDRGSWSKLFNTRQVYFKHKNNEIVYNLTEINKLGYMQIISFIPEKDNLYSKKVETIIIYPYGVKDLRDMLQEVGFRNVRDIKFSLDKNSKGERILFIAQKKVEDDEEV